MINSSRYQKGHKGYWLGKKRPPFSEKAKVNISKSHIGNTLSEITKKKIGEANKISHKGVKLSEKHRQAISIGHTGIQCLETTRKNISKALMGEKSPTWKGGISFEPYSIDWTRTLKRSIRERDHYTCQLCGKEPSVYCHHIDYNKKNCDPKNLITLCHSCHSKTNFDRNYWIDYFIAKIYGNS